jgi:hypothetical protein
MPENQGEGPSSALHIGPVLNDSGFPYVGMSLLFETPSMAVPSIADIDMWDRIFRNIIEQPWLHPGSRSSAGASFG